MRDGVNARITLRGGPECYVEISARGSVGRFHGATAIYDVLREICNVDGSGNRGAGGRS